MMSIVFDSTNFSVFVSMDKKARRLSKFLEIIRRELEAYAKKGDPIIDVENTKLR